MKNIFAFIFIISISLLTTNGKTTNNQQNSNDSIPKTKLKAIAIAGINSEGKLNIKILEALKDITIDDSFIPIRLSKTKMPAPGLRKFATEKISSRHKKRLTNWLNDNKTGQEILSQWFNRQPDGSFSLDYLQEAGFINDSAKNRIESNQPVPQNIAKQLANSPLNETFLLVLDFQDVQTMENYYNETETDDQNRILSGFIASINTFIFKLDFNRWVAEKFLNDYYTNSSDSAAQAKHAAFNKSEFPFFFVSAHQYEIASVQQKAAKKRGESITKTDDELLGAMANLAVKKITDLVGEGEISLFPGRVISNEKPVTAQFGVTDNLKYDNRYNVYKNQIAPNGKIKPEKVSVVKSMTVGGKNKLNKNASREASFYKIARGRIIPGEMFLEKKIETGINLFIGNSYQSMSGTIGRFEYYFSKTMGGAMIPGKTAKGLTSVKLYFEAAQNKKHYILFNKTENFKFTRGSIGIEKEYHPLPFMHCGPFIGYGLEYTTWDNSDYLLSTNFAEFGARLGINLRHNVQLISSATYYHLIKTVLMDGNRDVVNPDFNYTDTFTDRNGIAYSIGFRVML